MSAREGNSRPQYSSQIYYTATSLRNAHKRETEINWNLWYAIFFTAGSFVYNCTVHDQSADIRAQNLKQGIVMKTGFGTGVLRMGLGSFADINICVMKYYFIWFLHILLFYESLKSKSTQMLRSQKRNSGVLFNDILLNSGLCVQEYLRILRIWNTKSSKID